MGRVSKNETTHLIRKLLATSKVNLSLRYYWKTASAVKLAA